MERVRYIYIYIHAEKQGDWVIGYGGVLDLDTGVLRKKKKENRGQTGDGEWGGRERRDERGGGLRSTSDRAIALNGN